MSEVLHFEETLGVVICGRCGSGVVKDTTNSINNHFRSAPHHLKGATLKNVHERIDAWPVRLTRDVPHPCVSDQPVPAIARLKIHHGWRCRHCDEGLGTDLVNLKTHLRQSHDIRRGAVGQDLEACSLQTLFREKRLIRWFRVIDVPATTVEVITNSCTKQHDVNAFVSSQAAVMSQIQEEEEVQARTVHDGSGHQSRVIPWVRSCGFDRHLKGLDTKEVRRSWRKPDAEEADADLVQKVASMATTMLGETWQWCVDGSACRLTRPMAVTLSQFWTEATIHARGFRVGIGPDTKARYFGLWASMIFCFWRVSQGHALMRQVKDEARARGQEGGASVDQSQGDDEDNHACGNRSNSSSRDDSRDNNDNTTDNNDDDDSDHADASEEGDKLFTGTIQQRKAFQECVVAAKDSHDEERLRQAVLRWSMAMIQHDLPRYRFESPVLSYCAMMAINHSSPGWKPPGNFNSSLSGMIYCAQLWIFHEACRIADDDPHLLLDDVLARLCQRWMRQERSTTYGVILNWRLMLFRVARQEVSSKSATWSLDGFEVCYQGTAISMEQITQLYHRTLDRARLILDRDLLLGADHLPRMSVLGLHEAEHRPEVGWWFALDLRNRGVLQGYETQLIEHIQSIPAIRDAFLQATNEWRPSAMRLYESHVQHVLECLFVLFQIFPPLRGPECMSATYRNTEKTRSVLLKHGRVMFYTTYHKGQAQWGSYKENVRFATTAVGNIVLDLLVYVQPLRRLFLWTQHGQLLPPQLWTKDGQVWDEKHLTRIMRKVCALAEVPALSESHWRQICASIIKMKFGVDRRCFMALMDHTTEDQEGEDDDDDGEEQDAATLARMSNHTVRTHNRAYANETSLVGANIWDGLIKRSHRACMLWSQFFGLEAPQDDHPARKRDRDERDDGRGMLKKIMLSVPQKHWSSSALLQEARKMYQNPQLQWRCVEQEEAVCAIVAGTMEMLVVMATGMGKSLLFQLPCCLPGAKTTVLVVPLVALRLDLLRRCRGLSIDCQEWTADHHTRAALVFISAEAATSEEGRAYVYRLHHEQQLDRIVIDECHLILTTSGYRRAMGQLALLRGLPVPFVYLTATLPPEMQGSLLQRHHLTRPLEVRASTRRSNLQYRVSHLRPDQQDMLVAAASLLQVQWQEKFPHGCGPHRVLVFTRTRGDADRLATILHCGSYHSDIGGVREKEQIIHSWASGTSSPFLVGTSGLGVGLDYPHVRLVMHVDEPYGLMEFSQESGRAGRDQEAAESLVVLRHGWRPRCSSEVEPNEGWMHQYLKSTYCRRTGIDKHMDGVEDSATCTSREESCDRCRHGGSRSSLPVANVSRASEKAMGPVVLLRQTRQEQNEMDSYKEALDSVQGQCMICRLRGHRDWQHCFAACRQVLKWEYIHAKREVLQHTRRQWVRAYDACFHCYQPQRLCSRREAGHCEYDDLVMQTVFGLFGHEERGRRWLSHEFGVHFADMKECLTWAGKTNQLGEATCVNGVVVLHRVLSKYV